MKKPHPETRQSILAQIRKNEQNYAKANELIYKLNDFIKDAPNEILSAAIVKLKQISDGEYLHNKRLFEDFKKLNK